MKKIFTLSTALFLVGSVFSQGTSVSFCDNFDSYQNGDAIAEISPNWNTWGELMTGTIAPFIDDASVSNTVASSGTNSLYFLANPGPGPQDILLMFDTTSNINQSNLGSLSTPYISGNFTFSQKMNIRNGAYLNFQSENIPGQVWSLEVNFDIDPLNPTDPGMITMSNTTYSVPFTGTFPVNTWFEFRFEIDLSNNIWELFIDGVSQGSFTNTINQIASLDLYTRAGDEYYIDDICYDYIPATLAPINAQTYIISPITGLVGQQRYPSVEVRNFGINTINSFDITFDYNGSQITENITNINAGIGMSSMQTTVVDFTNPIILASGITTGTAYIYNINNGTNQSTTDDTLTISISAVTPAVGKLVIGEEATGTWCGWCPRGAVALNWMDRDYEGYWQGIAVHNGDPMTDSDYDNGIAPYIGGYPSGIVDRGQEINPAAFKQDFLQRIVVDPNGIITNGAELTGNTLKVNLTINFQNSVSGNYKLACVLVEDSVTGTTPQYYQSNSYSGGGAGSLIDVDGSDWANKPSSVPASQMVYRHVARGIAPNFNGNSLANTSYNSGDTETLCFEFILDPLWDLSQIHIVGMLIDNGNMIDNASSSSIDDAINNGYNSCTTTSIGLELNGPDKVNIYPNPATDNIYISNLFEKSIIKIYDIQGKLVLENEVSDKEYINISNLTKGIYKVNFKGNNLSETRKLILN